MKYLVFILIFTSSLFGAIGKITTIKGEVYINRDSKNIPARAGSPLETSDKIITKSKSKAILLFNDKTSITVGKNSELEVKKYIFNNTVASNNEAEFKFGKGVFRTITGRISKLNRSKFKIKTRTASIGIRGTHVLASVEKDIEQIACTSGSISVLASGGTMFVDAGMVTYIMEGKPTIPKPMTKEDMQIFDVGVKLDKKLLDRIDNIKLSSDFKFDKKHVVDTVRMIHKIEDADIKQVVLSKLENNLMTQLDELAKNKIDAGSGTGYDGDTLDYSPLLWGYYTDDEITMQNSQYVVGESSFDNLNDAILAATPDDVWRVSPSGETPVGTIASYIGTDLHWDGNQETRYLGTYNGKILGFVKDENNNFTLVDTENNNINLTFDFGNRMINGNFAFSDTNGKMWNINVNSLGESVITPANFDIFDFFNVSGQEVTSSQTFYNRFFGSKAQQLSGYIQMMGSDKSELYGIFALNKDEFVKMEQTNIDREDDFEWGYWTKGTPDSLIDEDIKTAGAYGAWVRVSSTSELSVTPSEYITTIKNVNYKADILGTVHDKEGSIDLIKDGVVDLTFDYGNIDEEVKGNVQFKSFDQTWDIDVENGTIDAQNGTFSVSEFATSANSEVNLQNNERNELQGTFLGTQAEHIMGGFKLSSDDGKAAVAGFVGSKQ